MGEIVHFKYTAEPYRALKLTYMGIVNKRKISIDIHVINFLYSIIRTVTVVLHKNHTLRLLSSLEKVSLN